MLEKFRVHSHAALQSQLHSCEAPLQWLCLSELLSCTGSLFGVSALTFGKWQLFASLGAVIFRTIGGPTILSSVLRTPGMPCYPPAPLPVIHCWYTKSLAYWQHQVSCISNSTNPQVPNLLHWHAYVCISYTGDTHTQAGELHKGVPSQ